VSSDRELVARALRRDPAALDELVLRLACVGRFLAARNARVGTPLRNAELTEVAQDVVVQVWERLSEYRGDAAIETWVYRFCEFGLMNALRRRRRHQTPADPEELVQPDRSAGLESSELERVYRALGRLGADEAVVVRRRHFDGASFEDLANELGEPMSTVKSRYYRALDKLRSWLETAWKEYAG
jgi:RNA polymerase sigma-70 factor (ECF subfamily)